LRPRSQLLLPPPHLSSCIFALIIRDTRGTTLSDAQRFNHFPASPLFALTHIVEGELRIVPENGTLDEVKQAQPLPHQTVMPPQDKPIASWSPGPIAALTIGFFPDAWVKLGYDPAGGTVPKPLADAFRTFEEVSDWEACWVRFCETIAPGWQDARAAGGLPDWTGADRLADWSRSMLTRAALAGPGHSIRTLERRIKRWSGQTRQTLNFYAAFEALHRLSVQATDVPLAGLASDAGYADQSHMNRAVQRASGFSPARLNRMIETEEAFWCYRLLAQRF